MRRAVSVGTCCSFVLLMGLGPACTTGAKFAKAENKVAIVLRGEVYRTSEPAQWEAWQSVFDNLVKPLEAQGHIVKLVSGTYNVPENKTVDPSKMLDQLKARVGNRLIVDERIGFQVNTATGEFQYRTPLVAFEALLAWPTFRWIIMMRHDMIIKPGVGQMVEAANPDGRFLFPFRMKHEDDMDGWNSVPDTLQAFDGQFLQSFIDTIRNGWPLEPVMVERLSSHVNESHMGYVLPQVWAYTSPWMYENPIYRLLRVHKDGPVAQGKGPVPPEEYCKKYPMGLCRMA